MRSDFVFVDIDTQYDFMKPDGRLYVPHAEQLIPNLKRLTEAAGQYQIPIIASVDAHELNDPEFAQFPPHCVRGTAGQKKIVETRGRHRCVAQNLESAWRALKKAEVDQLILEKQKFDVFSNPLAAPLFAKKAGSEFLVYGVATDYCVKAAVLGLLARGHAVLLVEDAMAGVTTDGALAALRTMRSRGARGVTTEAVMALLPSAASNVSA